MKAVKILTVPFIVLAFCVILWAKVWSKVETKAGIKGESSKGELFQAEKARIIEAYGKIPIHFIKNNGQVDGQVLFYAKGAGQSVYFTREGIYIVLSSKVQSSKHKDRFMKGDEFKEDKGAVKTEVIKLIPINANKDVEVVSEGLLPGKVNYFVGNDPKKWKTDIPTYAKVRYRGLYPGIDLVFYGNQGQIEYDLVVSEGADWRNIAFRVEGAKSVRKIEGGDLEIKLSGGSIIIQKRPVIYQEIDGNRVNVEGSFEVKRDKGGYIYAFKVGEYDKTRPLVIDPLILSYSTYLGGRGDDYGLDIAVDSSGNVYVTGNTKSPDFPIKNAYQGANAGGRDVFVAKLSPSGSLIYSTYLGGRGDDIGYGIAVDSSGNVYVTGNTNSSDFPIKNAYQGANAGGRDVFVAKLSPSGSLIYSTYLGGSDNDHGNGIAVDSFGNAYVTGMTRSPDFPTKNAYQKIFGDFSDVFVAKLSPSGDSLIYSTFLGGSRWDYGYGIAVDSSGNAYVTGETWSTDFPTKNAYQRVHAGGVRDVFVAKLSPSGDSLIYSTYLGGRGDDIGYGIAVDSSGNAYVTGWTWSTDFPTKNAYQRVHAGGADVFVAKLSPSGDSLIYSTYLGGRDWDFGYGIAVDSSGNAYVTGKTRSNNFPTKNAYQGAHAGGVRDVFVTKLSPFGRLIYSTYLGGRGDDIGYGIAVDSSGNAYVTGWTWSTDFPTKNAYQRVHAGGADVFVAKLSPSGDSLIYSTYLGGRDWDFGYGIAVDSSGNAYVTGKTRSNNFPTKNAYQGAHAGGVRDVFVTKLSPFGRLIYSTYLGGRGDDIGYGIAVDSSGNAYVTGWTASDNFPTQNAYQGSHAGGWDVFVVKDIFCSELLGSLSGFLCEQKNPQRGFFVASSTARRRQLSSSPNHL